MQIPIPTPSPTPSPAEVVRQATEIINTWNDLTPLMAVLGVAALALAVVMIISWNNRNSSAAAIEVLAKANAQKEQELADLKEQRRQEHEQHIESLAAIADQNNRANDLSQQANTLIEQSNSILKAQMDRGLERDATQKQLADDFHALMNTGSKPVQEILSRVHTIAKGVEMLDTRTADWPDVLKVITPLLIELGALKQEAKKHSTQPIPAVNPAPQPEINPL